ncbi:hypothetical protein D3C86_1795680 [compost metagenome]
MEASIVGGVSPVVPPATFPLLPLVVPLPDDPPGTGTGVGLPLILPAPVPLFEPLPLPLWESGVVRKTVLSLLSHSTFNPVCSDTNLRGT